MRRFKERFRYWLDGFMAKGSSSAFVALTVIFLATFTVIALVRLLVVEVIGIDAVERGDGSWRQVFLTFLEITDPGSMTQDVDSSPWIKLFAILAGMAGIVLFSALIAFITTALDQKLKDLRKGHSKVIEDGHTLILGWNDSIADIVKELILANESEEEATIVILAEKDKEEMDDHLALHVTKRQTTKIVTRSGSHSSLVNLNVASAATARSVVILSAIGSEYGDSGKSRSDMTAIKSLLALRQLLDSSVEIPIVVEIFNSQYRTIASNLGINKVVGLDSEVILSKILVQTSRSEGLAVVYEEMLSFDGAEIYLFPVNCAGLAFGAVGYYMPDGIALGVVSPSSEVVLNPPTDHVLRADEKLLVLASDDSEIAINPEPVVQSNAFPQPSTRRNIRPERELIIGWTQKLQTVIEEYGEYVANGSVIDLVPRGSELSSREELRQIANSNGLELNILDCDPYDTDQLAALRPETYDNVIVLSEARSAEWADAESLLILIQLQHILRNNSTPPPTLIAEVLDTKNRQLFTQAGISEFVISNKLVSMLSAQMSEDAALYNVYSSLFSESGSEVYLKPMSFYFDAVPTELSYGDLIVAAQKRGEIALGFRKVSPDLDAEANFGVVLIPPKDQVHSFTSEDCIVVLAEDET